MTLSASDLAARIVANIAAVPSTQIVGPGDITANRNAWMLALAQAVVSEITANAVVHTVDSRGDVCNNGTIT